MKKSKKLTVWQQPRPYTPEFDLWHATKIVEHYIWLLQNKSGDNWHLAKNELLAFIENDCDTEDITP